MAKKGNRKKMVLFFSFIFFASFFFAINTASFTKNKVTDEHLIVLNNEGFSKQALKVTKGARITWKNHDANPHWPASDSHPTHNEYPERGGCLGSTLDSCRPLKRGESYSFTFNKIGTWSIHDHLSPGHTMTVVVYDPEDISTGGLAAGIELSSENLSEAESEIVKVADENPKKAWEDLKKLYVNESNQITENPHNIAHIIGNKLYDLYGFQGIATCDDSFIFGCQHGVAERMFSIHGLDSIGLIEKECDKIWPAGTSASLFSGCIHGAGHGLISWRGLEIKKALKDCDKFSYKNRSFCHNGVVMEFTQSAPKSYFDKDDPWEFCGSIPGYEKYCAAYMSSLLIKRHDTGYEYVSETCMEAPDDEMRNLCFGGLGSFISQTAKGDFDRVRDMCMDLKPVEQEYCIEYSADKIVFLRFADWENTSLDLCNLLKEPSRQSCFDRLNQTRQKFYR